jgi:hypothetical protein
MNVDEKDKRLSTELDAIEFRCSGHELVAIALRLGICLCIMIDLLI